MSTTAESKDYTSSDPERLKHLLASEGIEWQRPTIRPRGNSDPAPLSNAQERLWFLHQLDPKSPRYNLSTGFRLSGKLSVTALCRALSRIVQRHEILRTAFTTIDGRAKQVVTGIPVAISVVDLSTVSIGRQETCLRRIARNEIDRPFDLSSASLIRSCLFRLAPAQHVFLIVMHHIASDGWSMGLIMRELATLYEAERSGQVFSMQALPIQYSDYAVWQRDQLREHPVQEQFAYWKQKLRDLRDDSQLLTDFPRTENAVSQGASEYLRLSRELTLALRRIAQKENATLFIVVLTALKVLLYRYLGEADVVVGTAIANRGRPELEQLIGLLVNTLVLRTDLSGNPTVITALRRVRETALEGYNNQDVPFDALVDEMRARRDSTRNPFFQVMCVWQTFRHDSAALPDLTLSKLGLGKEAAGFDLHLSVYESSGGLLAEMQYRSDLFASATVSRMLQHLRQVLEAFTRDVYQCIEDIDIQIAEDTHLLAAWNDTRRDWAMRPVLPDALETQAACAPDRIAVVAENTQVSYRALQEQANRLAHFLLAHGVRPEERVAVCLQRSVSLVVALLGVLKAGAAFVPLDPDYPEERLSYMVTNAGVKLVLTGPDVTLPANLPAHQVVLAPPFVELNAYPATPPAVGISPAQIAYVIYTSGSTGQPKGAMNTHAAICNRLWWMQEAYELAADDCVLQKTPISFDVSVWEFFWPLLTGATLVLARPGGHRDSRYLMEVIEQAQLTTAHFVPSMLEAFVRDIDASRCASLRRVIASGEALGQALSEKVLRCLPKTELHNLYGPTEAAIDVTSWKCQLTDKGTSVPIGRPIANMQVHVLDRAGQPVPFGAPGELYLGGVGLARGYANRPDLTAERFVPDAWSGASGSRLYRTGDRARWRADGQLEFLGRLDQQVKIRGYRIELGEIEAVLALHPGVAQCVATVQPTPGGDVQLVAYAVPVSSSMLHEERGDLTAQGLQTFLVGCLPTYMVPVVMLVGSIPLTQNGKVDRLALSLNKPRTLLATKSTANPRDSLEAHLTQIWQDLLERDDIGIRDDFFDLGGHSLRALALAMRMSRALGMDFGVDLVFSHRTIEQLAAVVRQTETTRPMRRSSLVPIQARGQKRPLFCVHPGSGLVHCYAGLSRQMGPNCPLYAFQSPALTMAEPPLDSIEAMAARYIHDLRAAFPSGPYQLAGLSMGAVVAFEMALQLKAEKEHVAFLVLIDGTYSQAPIDFYEGDWKSEIAAWGRRYVLRKACNDLRMPQTEMTALGEEARLMRYLDEAKSRDMIPEDVTAEQFRRFLEVFATNERAMFSYRPRAYKDRVAVVRCELADDAALGWSRYAEVAEIAVIGRRHGECIEEPALQALADFLTKQIEHADVKNTPRRALPMAPSCPS